MVAPLLILLFAGNLTLNKSNEKMMLPGVNYKRDTLANSPAGSVCK
jgi:hypothetical protein